MAWNGAKAAQLNPFDWESDGAEASIPVGARDSGFYEGRLPIHSSDASYSTQVFTMDAETGAYTFGYDTGNVLRRDRV